MFFGSRVGGMLSVPIALLLINRWGWRLSFVIVGAIGLVWAAAWFALVSRSAGRPFGRLRRASSRGLNRTDGQAAERAAVDSRDTVEGAAAQPEPLRDLRDVFHVRLRSLLLFHLAADVSHSCAGVLAAERRAAGRVAVSLRGPRQPRRRMADRRARPRPGPARSALRARLRMRSWPGPSSPSLPRSSRSRSRRPCCWRWRLGSVDLALSACWAVCLDIGRDHAGVVTGCMNTFSNLGGVLTPLVVAYAVDRWQSWTFPFYVTAIVYAAGALIWLDDRSRESRSRATGGCRLSTQAGRLSIRLQPRRRLTEASPFSRPRPSRHGRPAASRANRGRDVARMATASRPALAAPDEPIATVATGMPFGI